MKRALKNEQSRQRILQSALREFGSKGYGASSINTLCEDGLISKGILYHYYKDKDALYLDCIGVCFDSLTAFLSSQIDVKDGDAQSRLTAYFDARLSFFRENPDHQRLFFEALLSPPPHLSQAIAQRRAEFDALNHRVLIEMLGSVDLRPDMKPKDVVELFRQYQDFVNATTPPEDVSAHEERCRRAVSVLLYGVAARKEETK